MDTFDDIKVLQYKVPGFENLSLDQKKLIYYSTKAALSGRDIIFDQNFKYNLPIRRTPEAIYMNYRGDRTTAEWKRLREVSQEVWFANGIHHHYSSDKFTRNSAKPISIRSWHRFRQRSCRTTSVPRNS